MARSHTKLSARVDDPGYRVRGREVGGKLHRRGEKTPPGTVSKAVLAHVEEQEAVLEAKITKALARINTELDQRESVAESLSEQIFDMAQLRVDPADFDRRSRELAAAAIGG